MLSGQSTKINKAASDAIIEAHVVMSFALSPTGRRLAVYSGLLTQHQSNIEVVFGLTNTALEWICSIAHSWLIERSRSLIAATYHWHSLRLHMYTDDCQVYLSTSIEDVPLAVSKFAACVVNISAWLSVCRLPMNAVSSCCGSARVSCWTRLTAVTSWCSARALPSLTPLVTSVLSSTMNCRWQLMSQLSVAPVTISFNSSDQ